MSKQKFSEWPGAWERHVIRKATNPVLFPCSKPPTRQRVAKARAKDQRELSELNQHLAELAIQCAELAQDSSADSIATIKQDLDTCYDTACGLGADLHEQKEALSMLNDIITTAIRRAMREDDEHNRLLLIKQESLRMRHLTRLNYPIVCDLLRKDTPILEAELSAALLCESDEAFTVALDVLDNEKRRNLAQGIHAIKKRLQDTDTLDQIDRKMKILSKRLQASHAIEEAEGGL